ncbi:methyltransferase domain-containing protein [Streptomyces olivoreticuli]|uniref:methyltransferase domain-containing protein n=1 Tax=Streptomyces olivoreticuli TaxID=68246 RepID=UPI0013C2E3AF|nr:methyltransferase domain-containing protein [Streptomyces olivoreticuli]
MSDPVSLAAQLTRAGFLDPGWEETLRTVRREDFVPDRVWVRDGNAYRPVRRADAPDHWQTLVYEDTALVTQVEDPSAENLVPSSSASMPRVVALMLTELRVRAGMKVLEIGTGTGYNAALLAHRLGDRNVTSVEVDPVTAGGARDALKAAGYTPSVITGDGTEGWAPGAPYDRVIATCAVHRVPWAWAEQAASGGEILFPWGTDLHNGVLVRLTANGSTASGPVVGDSAFMWLRAQAPRVRDVMACVHDPDDGVETRTGLDPRLALGDDDAAFAVGVRVPGCRSTVGHGPDGEWTLWLADAVGGSWASVDYVPGETDFAVRQRGPRALWSEVEEAYVWWQGVGAPVRTRYGLSVTPAGQSVWLDEPGVVVG